jgi:hypothetical protein
MICGVITLFSNSSRASYTAKKYNGEGLTIKRRLRKARESTYNAIEYIKSRPRKNPS